MNGASPWVSPPKFREKEIRGERTILPTNRTTRQSSNTTKVLLIHDMSKFHSHLGGTHGNDEKSSVKVADEVPEIEAKIAAAEARTDTKFAEFMGELRVINKRLDHMDATQSRVEASTSSLKTTIVTTTIGAAIGAVALVVGIFGWGSQMFGVGMDAGSIATQSAKTAVERVQPQLDAITAKNERVEQQLGVILKAIESSQQPSKQ